LAGARSALLLGAIFFLVALTGDSAGRRAADLRGGGLFGDLFLGDARSDDRPRRKATSYHFGYGFVDCAVGSCTSVPAPEGKIPAEVKGSGDLIGKGAGVTEQEVRTITNATASAGVCRLGPDHRR
jgi:hypothetical protein